MCRSAAAGFCLVSSLCFVGVAERGFTAVGGHVGGDEDDEQNLVNTVKGRWKQLDVNICFGGRLHAINRRRQPRTVATDFIINDHADDRRDKT